MTCFVAGFMVKWGDLPKTIELAGIDELTTVVPTENQV
jgi:hypothetical protein